MPTIQQPMRYPKQHRIDDETSACASKSTPIYLIRSNPSIVQSLRERQNKKDACALKNAGSSRTRKSKSARKARTGKDAEEQPKIHQKHRESGSQAIELLNRGQQIGAPVETPALPRVGPRCIIMANKNQEYEPGHSSSTMPFNHIHWIAFQRY